MARRLQGDRDIRNLKYDVKGDKLVLTVDLSVPGIPSSTGKTVVLGTSEGNTGIHIQGVGAVKVGVNIYRDPLTEDEIKDCIAAKKAHAMKEAAGL